METTGTPTPEELLDAGRRTIDRKALQKTIKDIFSYRNPLRQFMESYRFQCHPLECHQPEETILMEARRPVLQYRRNSGDSP